MKDIIFPITYKSDEKGLKVAESQLSGFGTIAAGAFASIGAAAVDAFARATKAVFDFSVDSVKAASSFTETTAAVSQVFGDSAKQLEDFAGTAAGTMGQSKTQFLQAAKTFGIFGKAAGLADDANADFSTTLTGLASDLASFNDTSIDDSITAIGAALRGESEPIRRFGVLLDDATLKARAMEMGIYDGSGSLTQQQRVLAAYEEILAQTTTQQGDFARTADGVANGSRTLQAVWENLQITVGEALLPALEKVLPQLTAFIDEMVASPEFKTFLDDLGTGFENIMLWLPSAFDYMKNLGEAVFPTLQSAIGTVPAALDFIATSLFGIQDSKASTSIDNVSDSMSTLKGILDGITTSLDTITGAMQGFNSWYDKLPNWLKLLMPMGLSTWWDANVKFFHSGANANDWLSSNNVKYGTDTGVPRGRLVGQATGGETTRAGLSWVGERGPELLNLPTGAQVIPLSKIPSGGSSNSFVINVNAGMGADGAAIGEQIVTAIRKYERTSGAVFAKA